MNHDELDRAAQHRLNSRGVYSLNGGATWVASSTDGSNFASSERRSQLHAILTSLRHVGLHLADDSDAIRTQLAREQDSGRSVLAAVALERTLQEDRYHSVDAAWPVSLMEDPCYSHLDAMHEYGVKSETEARATCARAFERRKGTWCHLIAEEFAEVVHAPDEAHAREELIQLAALCVAAVESIDRRSK